MKTKEVKFGVRTEQHDFDVKVKAILNFLYDGNRVHVVVQMRGREQAHPHLAFAVLDKVASRVDLVAKVIAPARHDGRIYHMTIGAKAGKKAV